jgi:hypothetical protein
MDIMQRLFESKQLALAAIAAVLAHLGLLTVALA